MKIEFYEPPMCCSTGLCGPSVDEKLVKLNENIEILKKKYADVDINRYMITQQPLKFRDNENVYKLIKEKGKDILPIATLDGKVIKMNGYPTLEELENEIQEK